MAMESDMQKEMSDLKTGTDRRKKSNLKEMFIVRYADDFRIYCRTKDTAERTMHAVIQWLREKAETGNLRKENKDYQCQKSLLRLPWVQDESSQERQQAGGNFIHR